MNPVFKGVAKELRQNGQTVKVVDGWQDRGRPFHFGPIKGLMFHHTASHKDSGNMPALGICTRGRSDLPGPLCHFLVARDGTIVIVAAGYANHAGSGGPKAGITSGNTQMIGVECENNGTGEKWGDKQKAAIATLFAVLLNRLDLPTSQLIGHKEWTSRKIDPAGIQMWLFRRRVNKVRKTLGRTHWRLVATKTTRRTRWGWQEATRVRKVKTITGGANAREKAKALRGNGWKVTLTEV